MKKNKRKGSSKTQTNYRWIFFVFFITLVISALMSFISTKILHDAGIGISFFILICIILISILFDILGVAITSATEAPFHSMASRKVRGAVEALHLLQKAERMSSFCNDVIGDICGVISGAAAVVIAVHAASRYASGNQMLIELLMSALVAALTVGGKAMGKSFAISESTKIVHFAGKILYFTKQITAVFGKKRPS